MEKRHIEEIAKRFEANQSLLNTLANLSNTVIQTALKGQNKFLFEILQNADDAPNYIGDSLKVEMTIIGDYLIVGHNGRGFNHTDVERICDYASLINETKSNDLTKTGYKGLGFKTLFNLANYIHISSNGYTFRFDKDHWLEPEKLPWQIIPIWGDDQNIQLLKQFKNKYSVNFVLKLFNKSEIINELYDIVNKPEVLLFLHHIDNFTCKLDIVSGVVERRKEHNSNFRCEEVIFYINNTVVSKWLLKDYKVDIPSQLIFSLRNGSHFIFPDKIKNAKEIICTFAVRQDANSQSLQIIKGSVFATLPTQVNLGLPYYINSSFILNLDRTQLHENEWNDFVLESFGYTQLLLLQEIALIPRLKNGVVLFLRNSIDHSYLRFKKAFLKGFDRAKHQIAWLPAYKASKLLKLSEAWVDQINFFDTFDAEDEDVLPKLVDYDVRQAHTLCQKNLAKKFDTENLFNDFEYYFDQLRNKAYLNFIIYLFEQTRYDNYQLGGIRKLCFLITQNEELVTPSDAFLEIAKYSVPSFLRIDPLDRNTLPLNLTGFEQWLVDLGMKRLTPLQVIKDWILKFIKNGEINTQNHLEILNYLTSCFSSEFMLLNETEMKTLGKLSIVTESGKLREVNQCFWPTSQTQKMFKEIMSKDDFVDSSIYSQPIRQFLLRIGLKNELTFDTIYMKFFAHLSNPNYLNLFWQNLINYWNLNSKYRNSNKLLLDVKQYFSYQKCLKGNDEILHISMDLFNNSFKNISTIDPYVYPTFECEDELPSDLEIWLGFKNKLNRKEILNLFKIFERDPKNAKASVYKTLLEQITLSKFKCKKDQSVIILLAENNTMQSALKLYYFKENNANFPENSSAYLKKLNGMSHNEMLEISKLCGVNVIPYKYDLKYKTLKIDHTAREFYIQKLPLIALQESRKSNEEAVNVLEVLFRKLQTIELNQCSDLTIKYSFQDSYVSNHCHFDGSKFYVNGSWTEPSLKYKIQDQMVKQLHITTDIRTILVLDKQEYIINWLIDQKFTIDDYNLLIEKIQTLKNKSNINTKSESRLEQTFPKLNLLLPQSKLISNNSTSVQIKKKKKKKETLVTKEPLLKKPPKEIEFEEKFLSNNSLNLMNSEHNQQIKPNMNCDIESLSGQLSYFDIPRGVPSIQKVLPIKRRTKAQQMVVFENQNTAGIMEYRVSTLNSEETLWRHKIEKEDEGWLDLHDSNITCNQILKFNEITDTSYDEEYSTQILFRSSEEKIQKIGRRGEEIVLHYLKNLHQSSETITIIWLNEINESGYSFDFVLKENNEIIEYIEVKSTPVSDKREFELSHQQILALKSYREKYSIYRLFISANIKIEILKNPSDLLDRKLIRLTPIQYNVQYQPQKSEE